MYLKRSEKHECYSKNPFLGNFQREWAKRKEKNWHNGMNFSLTEEARGEKSLKTHLEGQKVGVKFNKYNQ
jgi:hypothetical protein